ncbi:MAG: hypothetical protein JST59_01980 [Actinobacteria bacterium]|nr:hypothetical protein [Actinomycetota bacterium]
MEPAQKTFIVGIRREDKSVWERRAVLAPKEVKEISEKHPEIKFVFQPSPLRIFSNNEYEQAGAKASEDLSACDLILGVKEVPGEKLLPDHTYMFFSHVIKVALCLR